jgi:hypothetical protein
MRGTCHGSLHMVDFLYYEVLRPTFPCNWSYNLLVKEDKDLPQYTQIWLFQVPVSGPLIPPPFFFKKVLSSSILEATDKFSYKCNYVLCYITSCCNSPSTKNKCLICLQLHLSLRSLGSVQEDCCFVSVIFSGDGEKIHCWNFDVLFSASLNMKM